MSNICNTCGANNDSLLSSCLYCQSPLSPPNSDTISDEELITEGGKWIGRIMESYYQAVWTETNSFEELQRGVKTITLKENGAELKVTKADVDSNVNMYLSVIQARSISNPNMRHIYDSFKADTEKNRKEANARVVKSQVLLFGGVIIFVVSITTFLMFAT